MNNILVIGSTNIDLTVVAQQLPTVGETILGEELVEDCGGKGANQAVAIKQLGGHVEFLTCVGNDQYAEKAKNELQHFGINTQYCLKANEKTGVAIILLDNNGNNMISVAAGANKHLNAAVIEQHHQLIKKSDIILMQCEIPLPAIEAAINIAHREHKIIMLNPAPAQVLTDHLLRKLHFITPNETEASLLTGMTINSIASTKMAAKKLYDSGVDNVIITLGKQGAYLYNKDHACLIPSVKVDVCDSTAAGDTFNGALAVALGENKSLPQAIEFANAAAACSVTKMGAMVAIPHRQTVDAFYLSDETLQKVGKL